MECHKGFERCSNGTGDDPTRRFHGTLQHCYQVGGPEPIAIDGGTWGGKLNGSLGLFHPFKWSEITLLRSGFWANLRQCPFIRPFIGVITPFITCRGPPCTAYHKFTDGSYAGTLRSQSQSVKGG